MGSRRIEFHHEVQAIALLTTFTVLGLVSGCSYHVRAGGTRASTAEYLTAWPNHPTAAKLAIRYGDPILENIREETADFSDFSSWDDPHPDQGILDVARVLAGLASSASQRVSAELFERDDRLARGLGAVGLAATDDHAAALGVTAYVEEILPRNLSDADCAADVFCDLETALAIMAVGELEDPVLLPLLFEALETDWNRDGRFRRPPWPRRIYRSIATIGSDEAIQPLRDQFARTGAATVCTSIRSPW